MKINHKKRKKLFNKMFLIPTIFFMALMLYAGYKNEFSEFKIAILGFLSIDVIWLIISYIISLFISLFLFKDEKEDCVEKEQIKYNNSNIVSDNCSYKKFEYSLKDYNLYTIIGEVNYVYAKRNKIFEGNKIKIKNSYNILITLLPFVIIHIVLVKLYILIILYLVTFGFIVMSYKKSIKNITKEGQITISQNGISLENTVSIFLNIPFHFTDVCFKPQTAVKINIQISSFFVIIVNCYQVYYRARGGEWC